MLDTLKENSMVLVQQKKLDNGHSKITELPSLMMVLSFNQKAVVHDKRWLCYVKQRIYSLIFYTIERS